MALQIFVSYAHADHALLETFLEALRPLADRLDLTLWWDEELQAGQKWDARIRAALDASDVFVCFVSNAFLKPGGYIMKTELPAIRSAEKSRGALVLPVIAEPSHWADEFGDTQAVPKTEKKGLRPIIKWSPRKEGFHEASLQLKRPIIDFLNAMPKRPDPGPGPAMAPTPSGFTILGKPPSEDEQRDPSLKGHHDDILDALSEIEPYLDRLGNIDPKLVKAVRTYADAARKPFAEVPLDRLWSLGGRLCERVETLSSDDLGEVFDTRTLRDVTGELNRLHRAHSVLMMSTGEGRELTGKIAAYRSASTPLAMLERAAVGVLRPMTRQTGLLEPSTRLFVASVAEPLDEGTERIDEIEAGLRTALHAVTAFVGALEPLLRGLSQGRPNEVLLREHFKGDPNLETLLAAFDYIGRHEAAVGTFAENNPDLRRYVDHTLSVLAGHQRKPIVDPDESPPDFDLALVSEMILRGEAPPKAWAKFVTELDFSGEKALKDLSPLVGLDGLTSLDLSHTSVTDLSPLADLGGLTSVDLSFTSVTDLSPLAGLGGLTSVSFSGTSVTDLSPLAGLGGLTSVDLSGTSVTDLSPLAGLGGLTSVSLAFARVADLSPLAGLGGLTSVYLSRTPVTDLSPLSGALRLSHLEVSSIAATDLTVIEALPALTILRADDLRRAIRWPRRWPRSLEKLSLFKSEWPAGHPLPDVPWRIDPDGTIKRGEGEPPLPFRRWAANVDDHLNPPPPPPPDG